ncbi:putative porin [Flavobacterium sp. J372]|uniref:putative porin n=1 Tax=Flavobacterium sp. J372 TaxID=2898436 RepID=UPI002150B89E|nr:putative porin [Flavobacterium sp. J372]MCR5863231.1 putative porin [Flavobacterium sp. J372]
MRIILILILLIPMAMSAQRKLSPLSGGKRAADTGEKETSNVEAKPDSVAPIALYKIITIDRDTTIVDTSLTLKRHYISNYLRKDNFGLLPFSNEGQTYNTLDFGREQFDPFPQFGFRAKHIAYLEVNDIKYYSVPTPFTDLFYRSVLQQGQMLDAFATLNTSENLNFAIAYKGLRSLGRYINELSSNGHFRFMTSYHTTNKRYVLKAHITAQDISNQENGGITEPELFESGEDPYTERERLDVYFRDATSLLLGNRYFIDHTFRLSKDNPNSILLHHRFNYENKFFEYTQATPSPRFGASYNSSINNKTRYNRMYNLIGAAYTNEALGTFEFYLEDYRYNYFYRRIILAPSGEIAVPNQINDRINTYGASYTYHKDKLKGTVSFSNSLSDQSLTNISVAARYQLNDDILLTGEYKNMNKLPNLNFQLYQSSYVFYNWSNNFKNEKINSFEFEAKTKWLDASVQYTVLNDHLYFRDTYSAYGTTLLDTLKVAPAQYNNTINYLSIKAGREFKWWKLALDNTFLYQNVTQQDNILNVPEFVTRNTLYFSDHFFKKALYLQTGVTFQYFTSYYGNNYQPLLGEFYVQERKKIGDYPLFDFFINAKIRTFRLFLKAEHFNSAWTGYNFYSAPDYPYRDFTFRFGIIWNFFS